MIKAGFPETDTMPAIGKGLERIDRQSVNWKGRPIYLRAYHPCWLVIYFGRRKEPLDQASQVKWGPLVQRVVKDPDLKIRIVEGYDDACAGCRYLSENSMGSVWGFAHSCRSAQNPEMVAKVTQCCRRTLKRLGLEYGDEILWRDLVKRLKDRIPGRTCGNKNGA